MSRVVWSILAAFIAIAAFFASIHWCHRFVVEEFDDKDVPHIFKMGRRQQEDPDGDEDSEFDHMARPEDRRDQESLEPTEVGLNTWEGGIALALYDQRRDIFAKLQDWYESDVAYDLQGLETELALEAEDLVTAVQKRT